MVPLAGLCLWIACDKTDNDQPMLEDAPIEHTTVYRNALKENISPALCAGALGFSMGGHALRCHHAPKSGKHCQHHLHGNSASWRITLSSDLAEQKHALRTYGIYRVLFPLVGAGMLLFPFAGANLIMLGIAITYTTSCSSTSSS